ncbi:MAG: hypothetical protein COA79_16170 [Planctomycetota bacterium]|nr:MAG: hypothetical protein COA79_16170 [Planctomycetota bacterium]
MKIISLNSGSNGNCFYVESNDTRIILEAGISGKLYNQRLTEINVSPESIDALLITHEHGDHIGGSGVINRKYGTPVFMSVDTSNNMPSKIGEINGLNTFLSGSDLKIKNLTIHTIPSLHDCVGGVHFVVSDGDYRVGLFTDLGHTSNLVHATINTLDLLFLESNYDPRMLSECCYPASLKKRIKSDHGHLSNLQSARLIRYYASPKLKHLILCHISEQANTYQLAMNIHHKVRMGKYEISVAPRDGLGQMVELKNQMALK